MSYKRDIYKTKNETEIVDYHSARYGAPGEPRTDRRKPSPEALRKSNQRRKERRCSRMVKAYFNDDDYVITFTYAKGKRPKDMAECKKHFRKLYTALRKEYGKRYYELFWIRNIEVGSRGAWHIHMVVNRIEGADWIIKELWPYGGVYFQYLKTDYYDQDKDIGEYIAKSRISAPEKIAESSWSHSRNIQEVEPKTEIIGRTTFHKELKAPKGYYLVESSRYEGQTPTGYPYRTYTFRRLVPKRYDHHMTKKKIRQMEKRKKRRTVRD